MPWPKRGETIALVLLPITHENMSARRWPIVTAAIIAVCLVALIVFQHAESAHEARVRAAVAELVDYYEAHPYLKLPEPIAKKLGAPSLAVSGLDDARVSTAERAEEQVQLDALVDKVTEIAADSPARSWGYVPADGFGRGLLTSQFLHVGWLHWIGNMWFLWLCGCNLEDRWGRLVFLPFYVIAGVVAALAHKVASPASVVPMIGASGAVAGATGAFLVLFATTRIRFVYWIVLKPGTFWAPAYLMLPLWLVEQVVYGLVAPQQAGGVAYWAHVGGFVFGALFAIGMRASGLDAHLDAAVERAVSTSQDPRLARAGELIDAGNALAGLAMLDAIAGERPRDVDVHLEMLRGAQAAGDPRRQSKAYARLVELYFEHGMDDTAVEMFREAQRFGLDAGVSDAARARAQAARTTGRSMRPPPR